MALPLTCLPIICLETITHKLDMRDIAKLAQCGDTTLNRKLFSGGVRSLDLCWTFTRWITWPSSALGLFPSLTALSITSTVKNMLCPSMDLTMLPSSLLSLVIEIDDVFIHLLRSKVNLSKVVPSLTDLKLEGSRLKYGVFQTLPGTLLKLAINSPNAELDSLDVLPVLPPGITCLKLGFTLLDYYPKARFPCNLERLEIREVRTDGQRMWTSKLPRTLIDLRLTTESSDWDEDAVFLDIARLPPKLTRLEGVFDLDWSDRISLQQLGLLPRSLTHLCVTPSEQLDKQSLSLLPPRLVTLMIDDAEFDDDLVQSALPSTLQRLDPYTHLAFSCLHLDLASILPNIKNLNFSPPSAGQNWPQTLRLPLHLLELGLPSINDAIAATLPRTLTRLTSYSGKLTEVGALALPSSLNRLRICPSVFTCDVTLQHLTHVPEMYWKLRTSNPLTITHQCLTGARWKEFYFALSHRSPLLQNPGFTSSFQHMTNLETLSIRSLAAPTQGAFTMGHFRFPLNLRSLFLTTLSSPPTPDDLRKLPPQLRTLDLSWANVSKHQDLCPWDAQTLSLLPRTLSRIALPFPPTNVTRQDLEAQLPPHLTQFHLFFVHWDLFVPPLERLYPADNVRRV